MAIELQISGLPAKASFVSTDQVGVDDNSNVTWKVTGTQILTFVQSGLTGFVTGPVTSVANTIPTFADTSGDVLLDSGVTITPSTNFLGVNNSSPSLSIDTSDGIISRGTFGSGTAFPTGFVGTCFAFDANQAAMRAGTVGNAGDWDPSNIGIYSLSFGEGAIASGNNSLAFGPACTVQGLNDIGFGASQINYASPDPTVDGGNFAISSFLTDATNSFAFNGQLNGYDSNFIVNSDVENTNNDPGQTGRTAAINCVNLQPIAGKANMLFNCDGSNIRGHGQNVLIGDYQTATDSYAGFFAMCGGCVVNAPTQGVYGVAMLGVQNSTITSDNGHFLTMMGGDAHTLTSTQYGHIFGGTNNNVSGDYSIALGGLNNTASGNNSYVGGSGATASGNNSFALGLNVVASGVQSIALGGSANTSGGIGAVAIGGTLLNITGNGSVGIGSSNITISGNNSVGFGTEAQIGHNDCFVFSTNPGPIITSGAGQVIFSNYGGFLINTNNPIAGFYCAKGAGSGTFLFSAAAAISSGSMSNFEVNPYVSGTDLFIQYKDSVGTAHTLDLSKSFIPWTTVSGTTQALSVNSGYVANNASQVVFTLPTVAAVGDIIIIQGLGAGGWKVAQNASQFINIGSSQSTIGVTGFINSTDPNDNLTLVCIVANTGFSTMGAPQGIINVF